MSETNDVVAAYRELRRAIERWQPELLALFREAEPWSTSWRGTPGAEQLEALWAQTGGQEREREPTLGVVGGLCLLGPRDSEREREGWLSELISGSGLEAVTGSEWGVGQTSLQPDLVGNVYFAAGWIPVFSEPMEANYLAVDLVPGPSGRRGQIILCGRDEDEKCVVAPDLATLLRRLAARCQEGDWRLERGDSREGPFRYVTSPGRLLSDIKEWVLEGSWGTD